MEKKHILICGTRGAGKSTIIERLMREAKLPISGYFTRSTARDENGFHRIYIHPAACTEPIQTEENHIGDCNGRERTINLEVFETRGVQYLRHEPGELIVMDELGFMESEATNFRAAVMACLDGDEHVLAGVRGGCDVEFLRAVKSHPKAELYEITPENRQELYDELLPIIRSW